ncbi:MAG: hypothetical protein AAGG01_22750 [Planctomycetota bacterium]
MLRWYPNALLRAVLDLTLLPLAPATVFALKVVVDPETPWRIGSWSGPGPTPEFFGLLVILALGWTIVTLGWRGAHRTFKIALITWHVLLAAVILTSITLFPDLKLHAETIGLTVSLSAIAPAYSILTLAGAIAWCWRDDPKAAASRSVSPLQRRNRVAAWIAVAAAAAGALAFALSHDGLGFVLTLAATVSARELVRPLDPSREIYRALSMEGSAFD